MARRNLLAKHKLEDFKTWLDDTGIPYRPGKGDYEVLQVMTDKNGWQKIYDRNGELVHYTVQDALMCIVNRYIYERKTDKKGEHHG